MPLRAMSMDAMQKINSNTVKRFNKSCIFRVIADNERLSYQDIAGRLRISLPTVMQNVRELQAAGLVCEVGAFESTGGRKAKAIALVPESRHAIGVAVAENHVEMVGVNLGGDTVAYTRYPIVFSRRKSYFNALAGLCGQFLEQHQIAEKSVLGVGFAIPGIVDQENARINDSYILKINSLPCEQFGQFIPYPSLFLNGANAACFAEFNGLSTANAVYMSLSYTIGGAVLINKEIFTGDHQRGGELGHMRIEADGRPCYCGKRGCLDSYCAAKVLEEESGYELPDFFERLSAKEAACLEVWDRYTSYLAEAINNIRMLFDCEVVVGGYVGGYLEKHIKPLKAKLAKLNTFDDDGAYVRACRFKQGAAAAGAALKHMVTFISEM